MLGGNKLESGFPLLTSSGSVTDSNKFPSLWPSKKPLRAMLPREASPEGFLLAPAHGDLWNSLGGEMKHEASDRQQSGFYWKYLFGSSNLSVPNPLPNAA
jgi:hypothetical protein